MARVIKILQRNLITDSIVFFENPISINCEKRGDTIAEEYMVGVCVVIGATGTLNTLLSGSCITKAWVAKYWLTHIAASWNQKIII